MMEPGNERIRDPEEIVYFWIESSGVELISYRQ